MSDKNRGALKEKQIRNDERKRLGKRKRAKGTLYTMLGALIAFLISIFSGFLGLNPLGIYSDGSGSHSLFQDQEPATDSEPVSLAEERTTAMDQTMEPPRIIVEEQAYIYKDVVYDLEGIAGVIEGFDSAQHIELVDRNAISDTFKEAEKILNIHNVDYVIVEE